MKIIQSIIFLVLGISLIAQEIPEKEISTQVNGVTVFFESAQVTRSTTIDVGRGKTVLKFTELSPFIDAKSIKARVKGQVSVLSVNHQQNFLDALEKPEELTILEKSLKSVQNKITLEGTYLSIIAEEIQFLQSNRVIGGKNQEVSVSTLREASDFYGEKLGSLKLKEIERRNTLNELNKEKNKILNQISTISSKKEFASGEILLTVKAEKASKLDVDLTYVVNNAGWYPSYDIKAVSVDKPLEIVYKANVHQDTKVEWKNIKLVFSSSNPEISSVAPELETYFLNYGTVPPAYKANLSKVEGIVFGSDGTPLPGANVLVAGTTIGTSTDMNGKYSITIPPNAGSLRFSYIGHKDQELPVRTAYMNASLQEDVMALSEVVVTGRSKEAFLDMELADFDYESAPSMARSKSNNIRLRGTTSIPLPVIQVENQTTVEFEISMPYTVKSDSKSYAVDMAHYEVPAYYEYYCIPKIDKDAFLIANIVDWEKYNLLEGEANLFFEETYIGKSILDTRFVNDTLSLSLGRDKNVSVAREKIKDIKTKKFIGTKQEDTRAWEIAVRNNKNEKINIVILDQVPVPMNTEIELNIANKSGGEYDEKSGEVKWTFTLDSKARKDLSLKYSIKYPKNKFLVID